ncbi:hypothetical protein BJ170DRAFT_599448 [Xylariales sp. AK1849]|nr:hypothetical protein BJ170DRAFT_599448 [Xylariales sp. AK1849]
MILIGRVIRIRSLRYYLVLDLAILGHKTGVRHRNHFTSQILVSEITRIRVAILTKVDKIEDASNAITEETSCATQRQTSRTEDLAYCLLGIFVVFMALLYGEQRGDFTRLQEILSKEQPTNPFYYMAMYGALAISCDRHKVDEVLAMSPRGFEACYGKSFKCETSVDTHRIHSMMTNHGLNLRLNLRIDLHVIGVENGVVFGFLDCGMFVDGTAEQVAREKGRPQDEMNRTAFTRVESDWVFALPLCQYSVSQRYRRFGWTSPMMVPRALRSRRACRRNQDIHLQSQALDHQDTITTIQISRSRNLLDLGYRSPSYYPP